MHKWFVFLAIGLGIANVLFQFAGEPEQFQGMPRIGGLFPLHAMSRTTIYLTTGRRSPDT